MPDNHPTQNRPATPAQAPDPATNYERAKPEKEAGMGRLDSPIGRSIPHDDPDDMNRAVNNAQPGDRQINAHDDAGGAGVGPGSGPAAVQPDHSMRDEEPTGWDQAPTDIQDPAQKRQPRVGG